MPQTVVLAGASGAIGRRLVPMLVADGYRVVGMSRSTAKSALLTELGASPVVADVFDALAVQRAIADARPDVVVHQLTDLPPGLDPSRMEEATRRNARIRDEGTRNLVAAAVAAGVRRLVAQSIAFAYANGAEPHGEEDVLATDAAGRAGISARGVASLEHQVLEAPLEGLVLRYGRLYGPGTGFDAPSGRAPLHVDAAARAAALAVAAGDPGVYNIAENDGAVSSEKAERQLGWSASWR
ncbi:MAG: NAD-dependent epimerase/dehydratase family protein [Steroidobacteraceae bacterium]